MNYKMLASLQKDQLRLSREREKAQDELINRQSVQLESLTSLLEQQSIQIEILTQTIQSLKAALLEKNGKVDKLETKNRGLSKIVHPLSEKQTPAEKPKSQAPSPKERGNNNAKRKEHFNLETRLHEVYPDSPLFDKEKACLIGHTDSIRYEFVPPKFIKHIYRLYTYRHNGTLLRGKAPETPLLNSSFEGSFIAGVLQLRYIYSMPVERIVKYFAEHGFEVDKATVHGLIAKSSVLLEGLNKALHQTILQDNYICMDETYHKVLTKDKNEAGKGIRKGYLWGALANHLQLIQFFYRDGSRSRKVLEDYVPTTYQGTIQSDGFVDYEILEGKQYPGIKRIGCLQHCKRKFLDIKEDKQAAAILKLMNHIYHLEHKIKPKWTLQQKLLFRQTHIPPVLEKLKKLLIKIKSDPRLLPSSILANGINYTLNQFDAVAGYVDDPDYAPDNNAIERPMRYISLSRKNSLFWGSHEGAGRAAIFYSLACSCRLHKINTFEYFADILARIPTLKPNEPFEVYRQLLPDKWEKQNTNNALE